MAADSTLVNAFFKESISRARADVPNLKPLYDSNVEIMKTGQKFVTGLIDAVKKENDLLRVGKDKQLSVFKSKVSETYEKLYSMDEPLPNKVVNALRDRIKELKADFEAVNTYGKNDTEENNDARLKILAQLKRITNSVVKTRETIMTISGDAKDWNTDRINPDNIETLQSFLDIKNVDANDNIVVDYIGGDLTWINLATGKQFTAKQMREAIPTIDKKIQQFSTDRIGGAQTKGRNDAQDGVANYYDNINVLNQIKSEYTSEILDEEDFMNASTVEIFKGSGTFKNDLLSHAGISTELIKNMYYTENGNTIAIGEIFAKWDKVSDGVIDNKDVAAIQKLSKEEIEAFKVNHKRIISALTNKFDPAFDLETSKQMWGEWATNKEQQTYNRQYNYHGGPDKTLSKVPGNTKVGNDGNLYNPATNTRKYVGWRLNQQGDVLYDDGAVLKSIQNHEEFLDAFGNTYKPIVKTKTELDDNLIKKESKTKGYILTDNLNNPISFLDGVQIGSDHEGALFYTLEEAKTAAVGKVAVQNINTSTY